MKQTSFLVVIASVLVLGVGASAQTSTRSFSADLTVISFLTTATPEDRAAITKGTGVAKKGDATGLRPVIGPFTLDGVRAGPNNLDPTFAGCPGGTIIKVFTDGAAVLTFANTEQLFLKEDPSNFFCLDSSILITFSVVVYDVVGGTGQYENATGSLVQGFTPPTELHRYPNGQPLFFANQFSLVGEINNVN